MEQRHSGDVHDPLTRRDFIKGASTVIAAGALAGKLAPGAYAQGTEEFRVGLIGCGGRGTGAAMQTLTAQPTARLVAMGDAFEDRLVASLNGLQGSDVADRVEVDEDHRFVGLDAFQKVIDSGIDVVLDCSVPHFRPRHLRAAVEAGLHVFAEKPVAVDAPGVRSILESAEIAKQKGLAMVSGLCWRYETGMQETIARVQEGAIGDIIALHSTRYGGAVGRPSARQEGWTDFQYQLRNWYFHTWLSGDFIAEQFVHELDKMSWLIGEYPVSCFASGGRNVRTGPEHGDIYDHFDCVYEYASGVKYFAGTRHWEGCDSYFKDLAYGSEGTCELMAYTITGANPWKGEGNLGPAYVREHEVLYQSVMAGEPANNGEFMAKSTLMGLMGRMAAYTGRVLTWDQVMNSQEDLSPPAYEWDAELPEVSPKIPGVHPFT